MRTVHAHLLEDKMDEAVTHYINSQQPSEPVQVDANTLALNVQDDGGGRIVTVMHPPNFSSQMCRQISVGEQVGDGPWGEELLDPEGRLAALVAHLAQHSRNSHHHIHPKEGNCFNFQVSSIRSEVDSTVILDAPMRLFNGQTLDQQTDPAVLEVPQLPTLPSLQQIKRCQDTSWFSNKAKTTLKDDGPILTDSEGTVLELANASPAQNKQSKKSLPHKKRISKKLKRNTGNSTPQQDIVVINCSEEVQHEEILPDNFVTVQHPAHAQAHHITHEVRPILLCQLCGEFYGEEQLKFYQHLKQHYEPPEPVPDLPLDKMTNTCIVDNVSTLPDSIVELTLESTVPKTIYQPIEKHILYTSSDKTLNYTSNKVQYSIASIDKETMVSSDVDKTDLYVELDKLQPASYTCMKCNKSFRKQKQCEVHIKEAHSAKVEEMGEFSEPEDLMEGIHVCVDDGEQYAAPAPPAAPPAPPGPGGPAGPTGPAGPAPPSGALPQLTVDNGHIHQQHLRHWYMRNGASGPGPGPTQTLGACPAAGPYCGACPPGEPCPAGESCPTGVACPPGGPCPPGGACTARGAPHVHADAPHHLKEEVLQRIFEAEVVTDNPNFAETIIPNSELHTSETEHQPGDQPLDAASPYDKREATIHDEDIKSVGKNGKKKKSFMCPQCDRIFLHRNSLMYHLLSHNDKQELCTECGKYFYTTRALKVHKRVHNDDRPYSCDECGKHFKQWSDLKYHKGSIHSKTKHFKCEFCGKEFARKYSLIVHRRIHTGERNYKCEYCNKTFRASSYRLSHMRTHTGVKPFKCVHCEKCFRVAGDLRRHMQIHDKVRNRFEEQKKAKDPKEKNQNTPKKGAQSDAKNKEQNTTKSKKSTSASNHPVLRNILDKKPSRKSQVIKKEGAPNVTVQNRIQLANGLLNTEYTNNVEVIDTRQVNSYSKFKEVYSDTDVDYSKDDQNLTYKEKIYSDQNIILLNATKHNITDYKDEQRLNEERELAILRNVHSDEGESEKYEGHESVENKFTVFTHIEKNKDYNGPIVTNSQVLNDIRHIEREVRNDSLPGETIENGFLERLTALYNIPAV